MTFFLVIFCIVGQLTAQDDLAFVERSNTENYYSTEEHVEKPAFNTEYLSATKEAAIPHKIKSLRKEVAQYDLTNESIYSRHSSSTYKVVFSESNNHIEVHYDSRGTILNSTEIFKNVPLPHAYGKEISKEYPGWAYENVWCYVNYIADENPDISYKVLLKKGNEKQTVWVRK